MRACRLIRARTVKEYPDENYRIKVQEPWHFEGEALHKHLPDILLVTINEIVRVTIGRSIAFDEWPPEEPSNFDEWENAADALLYVFNLSDLSVGVSDVETVKQANREDRAHVWLGLPHVEFGKLYEDACSLTNESVTLQSIEGRPLANFLRRRLPESPLNDYQKKILCIGQDVKAPPT
jgi:hypothetical protein